jgi:capsular polysaccharide export protein
VAREAGIELRVRYIHDQHLPTLLMYAHGVVVINSTVGLSAIHHGAPTKVCGKALYDMPGLTYQGTLDEFWSDALYSKPDQRLYQRFRNYLVAETQLNGSFYKPLKEAGLCAGLIWDTPFKQKEIRKEEPITSYLPQSKGILRSDGILHQKEICTP